MTNKSALIKAKGDWKRFFTEEYLRLHNPIGDEYNRMRKEDTPSWVTIAKMFGIKRWKDWLKFCGLETKISQPHCLKVQIHSHFLDEVERLWSREKINEFFPELTCEILPSDNEDVRDVADVLKAVRKIRKEYDL